MHKYSLVGTCLNYLPFSFHGARYFTNLRLRHSDRPKVFDIVPPESPRMQANQTDAFKTKLCLLKSMQLQRQKQVFLPKLKPFFY